MNGKTIDEIYASNQHIREKFIETLSGLSQSQVSALPEGEKWTIAQIAEHVSMVENGMARICSKLLSGAKAAGQLSDGTVKMSDVFTEKSSAASTVRLEAPEMVRPSHEKTIAESLAAMDENRDKLEELRPLFKEYDCNIQKFPHPFFGDLSASEWLLLVGGHEARHLKQITNLVEKIG
ncbi:MAG: DinB family protein [Pyrinomonadaceae bacterium]